MTFIHTLYDAQAPGRADSLTYLSVRIEQSLDAIVWTMAEVQGLVPPDPDPANPLFRDLTFESPHAAAYFRLVFIDINGNESPPTAGVWDDGTSGSGTVPLPTTRDVASFLPTRPKTQGGVTLLDFTEDTFPTKAQIQDRINSAYRHVYSKTGPVDDPDLALSVTHLISLYASMLTELGFYPEQVNNDKSPYKELKKLYDDGMRALIEALGGDGSSVLDDIGAITENTPSYAFPPTSIGDGIMP